MNSTRYVGITGFMSRAEVDAALDALPDGLTLMCGALVSEKTLRGERNKWWRRYPKIEDIANIFSDDPRCLNLIHYCASDPPNAITVSLLQKIGGAHCHGFQFNGAWPKPSTLAALSGDHVVLQLNPRRANVMADLGNTLRGLRNTTAHVLIDGSGGRGEPIDSEIADTWAMMIRGHFGNDVGLGFAGGLCAERLPYLASEIRTWGASIDAEGRLRDGDEGGVLSIDKVRKYLHAAGEVILQGAS